MNIKQLAQLEVRELPNTTSEWQAEVEHALKQLRHTSIRLFLPENDQYRLLKLKVWTEAYDVDLFYILSKLLPHWEQFVQRRSKKLKSQGLGVRVATLTGKKSEEMLKFFINQDFPSGQNTILRKQSQQDLILERELNKTQSPDGIKTSSDVSKTLFDFPGVKSYLRYYRRRIRKRSYKQEQIFDMFKKRPYRGNPFMEGLLD